MRELSDILPDWEAPPGGLSRLRRKLDQPRSRGGSMVAVLAAAVLLAALWPRPVPRAAPEDPVIAALEGAPRAARVSGSDVVASQVMGTSPGVLYFRVASVAADPRR